MLSFQQLSSSEHSQTAMEYLARQYTLLLGCGPGVKVLYIAGIVEVMQKFGIEKKYIELIRDAVREDCGFVINQSKATKRAAAGIALKTGRKISGASIGLKTEPQSLFAQQITLTAERLQDKIIRLASQTKTGASGASGASAPVATVSSVRARSRARSPSARRPVSRISGSHKIVINNCPAIPSEKSKVNVQVQETLKQKVPEEIQEGLKHIHQIPENSGVVSWARAFRLQFEQVGIYSFWLALLIIFFVSDIAPGFVARIGSPFLQKQAGVTLMNVLQNKISAREKLIIIPVMLISLAACSFVLCDAWRVAGETQKMYEQYLIEQAATETGATLIPTGQEVKDLLASGLGKFTQVMGAPPSKIGYAAIKATGGLAKIAEIFYWTINSTGKLFGFDPKASELQFASTVVAGSKSAGDFYDKYAQTPLYLAERLIAGSEIQCGLIMAKKAYARQLGPMVFGVAVGMAQVGAEQNLGILSKSATYAASGMNAILKQVGGKRAPQFRNPMKDWSARSKSLFLYFCQLAFSALIVGPIISTMSKVAVRKTTGVEWAQDVVPRRRSTKANKWVQAAKKAGYMQPGVFKKLPKRGTREYKRIKNLL